MKEVFEGLFSSLFIRDFAQAVQILEGCDHLSPVSKRYLAKKKMLRGGVSDKDIVKRVLRYEGITMEFCPMAMTSFENGDAAVKKQQQLIKALAPAMYDGMVLCARTPVSQGPTVFYGFKVKGGRACRLRVRLEEY